MSDWKINYTFKYDFGSGAVTHEATATDGHGFTGTMSTNGLGKYSTSLSGPMGESQTYSIGKTSDATYPSIGVTQKNPEGTLNLNYNNGEFSSAYNSVSGDGSTKHVGYNSKDNTFGLRETLIYSKTQLLPPDKSRPPERCRDEKSNKSASP
ncbi:hypothetical protein [Pseudomonas savastanoi]|uniref:hypothetical protein n=1 Tax=Pseudomonas savastanoi TaxID=29438 RepID=UPI000F2362FB|nr:hypothetical protein [Pseudomonas savastanoi]RML25589.1 hypothetical protein ALR00_03173 [Pseudomonas savastanoi pv. retacarpa]